MSMLRSTRAIKTSPSRRSAVVLLFALAMSCAKPSLAHLHSETQKLRIHFLATGTLLHGTWGLNQDIYLAELISKTGGSDQLIRIVDEYPQFAPPLPRPALIADNGTVLRIKRDDSCNVSYGSMHLRTAPGEPMAILYEHLVYQPPLRRTPELQELLPCYRIVRPL